MDNRVIVLRKPCGCIRAATVAASCQEGDFDGWAERIRQGYIVDTVTDETVRLSFGGDCEACRMESAKQAELSL